MDRAEILDYVQAWTAGDWYEPPVSWSGLAKTFRASAHHGSAIYFKRNVLSSAFIPHKLLSREEFDKWVLDFLTFGNSYIERPKARIGSTAALKRAPAKHIRRRIDLKRFVQLNGANQIEREFELGSVHQLMEPDINQEVYGLPEYLGALHAAWLNESATLFRRRYYENGSHAGFILYMTDAAQSQSDVDKMRAALKNSKGPGNFRNMFIYAPNGKKDGLQLIPVSEVMAKDEFFNIKNVSRDDMLAAHRIPPQLMGIVPSNTGGFGATDKANMVFMRNEIEPLQRRLSQLNDWIGEPVVTFNRAQEQ
ncbi:capsid portal protein [Burkholderia stagnalis]|nr:capsid portal protein [Burkholderia stagnalis]KWD04652.1 capsid portal protein [Burkholderia stagnalis]